MHEIIISLKKHYTPTSIILPCFIFFFLRRTKLHLWFAYLLSLITQHFDFPVLILDYADSGQTLGSKRVKVAQSQNNEHFESILFEFYYFFTQR